MNWLEDHQQAYEMATSFADTNWKKQWQNNIRAFQSKHPIGSKYLSEGFKYRSKVFRPKTRAAIRKNEAAGVAAFFSTMDAFTVAPVSDLPEQQISAEVLNELIKYRLAEPKMKWFLTCIGALQDANKMGVCFSYNYWKNEKRMVWDWQDVPELDVYAQPVLKEDGTPITTRQKVKVEKVVEDRPCIELYPAEQILFHPGANWLDPLNDSPFLIRKIPMYVYQVRATAKNLDDKTGQPKWRMPADGDFLKAKITDEQTRMARQGGAEDPTQVALNIRSYDMVWVHEVFMRDEDGNDNVFYTLGTEMMLTDPLPIGDVYLHGIRPITMGYVILETHKLMQPGIPEVGEQLQKEANDIANARLENIKLVLNKRFLVKRGKQVDVRSLTRNVAGGVTMVDDTTDVQELNWQDVTSSSFNEQSLINIDFDDLLGAFSSGSVQSNRSLNETVGGLSLIHGAAAQMTDYGLKTFTETWLEPTLQQLVKLEQYYETDEKILALASSKSEAFKQMKENQQEAELTEELMQQDLLVSANVGIGSSNPVFKLERFLQGMNQFMAIAASPIPGMNRKEVAKEIFGYMGYKDGSRFFDFDNQDPEKVQLTQQVQQLMQQVQQLAGQLQDQDKDRQVKLAGQEMTARDNLQRDAEKYRHELIMEAIRQVGADQQMTAESINKDLETISNANE